MEASEIIVKLHRADLEPHFLNMEVIYMCFISFCMSQNELNWNFDIQL